MAREVALEILLKYHNEHSYLNITLNEYLKNSAFKIRYLFYCLEKGHYKWLRIVQRLNRFINHSWYRLKG